MNDTNSLGTVIKTDVLVLGAGGAGMCAALKAKENNVDVLLIDKMGIGWNGQVPIGGGILAYVYPDYAEKWAEKATRNSGFFNDQDWAFTFGKYMHQSMHDLAAMGLTFIKKNGEIDILTWGPNIHVTLFDAPKSLLALKKTALARGVKMMDKIYAIDLLKKDDKVVGAVGLGLVDGKTYLFNAKTVIITTGNCGYMHEKTYSSVLGEGPAMGYRAGAQLINAEFSSSYVWGIKVLGKELMGIHFYLYLENARGEKIMGKHYPELMVGKHSVYTFDPRVIDAMQKEMNAGLGPIYLNLIGLTDADIAGLAEDQVEGLTHLMANDTMKLLREKAGIDPLREKMEMWPRYLYSGGGLRIDIHGKTTLDGLYAAGGASSNCWSGGGGGQAGLGVQSAAVTGFVAGENAARYALDSRRLDIDGLQAQQVLNRVMSPTKHQGVLNAAEVIARVHEAVVPMKYNRQREAGRMKEALGIVQDARDKLSRVGAADFHELARYHSAESMIMAAENTYRAALMREESRAGHFREDFPQRDDKHWFKWITIQQQDGVPQLATLPVPLEKFRLKP
ncbi:MAG: FAD-binding protein [Dehalococcoidales bacterium]|jgi:succinate dehydrogenase/fumarate reductase flavoprotein subunit